MTKENPKGNPNPTKTFANYTKEELAEFGRKGGKKSGEVKRMKKNMKQTLEVLMSMPLKRGKQNDPETIKAFADLRGKNISVQDAILIAQVQKALKGDKASAEYVRDTIGQKPDNKMNIDMSLPVFYEGEDDLEE